MIDRWFSTIKLPMTWEKFLALPQNVAYKYEYIGGETWLTPRPKQYHALLDLRAAESPPLAGARVETGRVRPFATKDWKKLPALFAESFERVQPFASLDDDDRLKASRQCLRRTREGGDGPLIDLACFVAESEDGATAGAALVTLLPDLDLTRPGSLRWKIPPPDDWLARKFGRPHLTWIFVGSDYMGDGVGTALLAASTRELRAVGYRELATTFLLGNESSTLWHWRNGFRLLSSPGSRRVLRERVWDVEIASDEDRPGANHSTDKDRSHA